MKNFIYNETPGNLFDYENDYALVHCLGADFDCSFGIARVFDTRYSVRASLLKDYIENWWHGTGYCLISNNSNILNLVTKRTCYEKATLDNVRAALRTMKTKAEERGIWRVAMPRIATGYDGLSWQDVHDIIFEVFDGSDFEIRVVYLNEYLDGNIIDGDIEKANFGKDRKSIDGNTSHKYY